MSMFLLASPMVFAEDQTAGDEEIMRPTERGLRLTPTMARAISQLMIKNNENSDYPLTDQQLSVLREVAARHLMQTARSGGRGWQELTEYMFEFEIAHMGNFDNQSSREFAERLSPMLPHVRGFFEGLAADARPILSKDQQSRLDEAMQEADRNLDRIETKMKRWADGEYKEGEHPFEDEGEDQTPKTQRDRQQAQARRHANRSAEREIDQYGPEGWSVFWARTKQFFKFDEQQSAKGDALLKDYRLQAEQITTDEWKTKVCQNRTKCNFRHMLHGQPLEPWLFHLDREFDDLVKPIKDMGQSFRDEVIALTTAEQREEALVDILKQATEHGMAADELDMIKNLVLEPTKD